MKHSHYSVHIPGGDESIEGYVFMAHGTPYKIRLENGGLRKCDAMVEIDGHHVGTWRIDARDFVILERPAHDTGRFTFFKVGTVEGDRAGIVKNEKTGPFPSNSFPNLGGIQEGYVQHPLAREEELD